jgi:hypothetical protein
MYDAAKTTIFAFEVIGSLFWIKYVLFQKNQPCNATESMWPRTSSDMTKTARRPASPAQPLAMQG